MAKRFVKIMAMGVLITVGLSMLAGCTDAELKHGVYVTEDGIASVALSENNEFTFNRGIMYSYVPTGKFSIKQSKLTLHVTNREEYVFNIKDGQLVYVRGDGSLAKGTIFKLL